MTILLITYLMLNKAGKHSSPNTTSTKNNSMIVKMVDGCSGYSFAVVVLVVLDVVSRRNANKIVANHAKADCNKLLYH
jgi:hypothetical protein